MNHTLDTLFRQPRGQLIAGGRATSTGTLLFGCSLSAIAAVVSFSAPFLIGFVCLFPLGLRICRRSLVFPGIVAISFYAVVGFGLVRGIHAMEGSYLTALLAWLVPSVFLGLPFICVHYFRRTGLFLAFLVATLPPIGLLGLPTPLVLSGFLFPGAGLFGLILTVAIFQAIVSLREFRHALFLVAAVILAAGMVSMKSPPAAPPGWVGHDLQLGQVLTADANPFLDHETQSAMASAIASSTVAPGSVVHVFPEGTAGRITDAAVRRLRHLLPDTPFIAGGEVDTGAGLDNVVVASGPEDFRVVYRQRVPAPFFMWRPGTPGSFRMGLDRQDSFIYRDLKIGVILCYEIALPYYTAATFSRKPDLVLILSNLWWTDGTDIARHVRMHGEGWSRLFGIPHIAAVNL